MVPEVLFALHNAASAGHLGVNKCSRRKSPQQPRRAPLSVAAQVAHSRELQWKSWALCRLLSLVRSTSWLLEITSGNGQRCFPFRIKKQRRLQKSWWMRSFPGMEHLNRSTLTRVTALKPICLRRCVPSSVLRKPGQHFTTSRVMAWLSGWTVHYRICWPSTSLSTIVTRMFTCLWLWWHTGPVSTHRLNIRHIIFCLVTRHNYP